MNITPNGIRCILFDLGSTLWERQPPEITLSYEREAEAAALTLLRALPPPATTLPALGERDDDTAARWTRQLHTHIHHALRSAYHEDDTREPDFPALYLRALQALGYPITDPRWGAMLYEALRVRSSTARRLYPDALSTLAALRSRGYALGIVTNRDYGGPIFIDDLRQMGLLAYFAPETIAISADLRFRKPHRLIFEYALAGVGASPTESAMVGDKRHADIAGAQRLGLFSVWKRPALIEDDRDDIIPDATITHLVELLTLFP